MKAWFGISYELTYLWKEQHHVGHMDGEVRTHGTLIWKKIGLILKKENENSREEVIAWPTLSFES